MERFVVERFLMQGNLMRAISRIYEAKGWVYPDGQDAATFCAQEAMEMVDLFLRNKTYVRNHEKPLDSLATEAAQTLMMLVVTCNVAGIDLEQAFIDLYNDCISEKDPDFPG